MIRTKIDARSSLFLYASRYTLFTNTFLHTHPSRIFNELLHPHTNGVATPVRSVSCCINLTFLNDVGIPRRLSTRSELQHHWCGGILLTMPPEDNSNKEGEKVRRLRRAMYSRSLSKKLRRRPRRELKPLESDIPGDWEGEEEGAPQSQVAPRGINITRNILWWVLGVAILFFVAAAGTFVYFFTVGGGSGVAAPGNVEITVRGPISVIGGEPAELQVIVTNRNQATLELADLLITYPDGTRSPSDFVTDLPRQRISLGSIEPGGQRQGTVSAVFIAKEGERKNVHVELEYRVADSNAIFVAEQDYQLTFTSAPVAVSMEANEEAISGQRIVVTTTVQSNVDTVLKDVLLKAEYPFGFAVSSHEPEPTIEEEYLWELGDLNPGETRTIVTRGTLEGQEGDERVFRFDAGVRRERDSENIDVTLSEARHRMAIARPFIGLNLLMSQGEDDTPTDTLSALPGEPVNVVVNWRNNLSKPISNAVIVARLEGLAVPGTSVRTTDGFYRSSDNTVLWDRTTTNGQLETLTPGESGSVRFSFDLPSEQELLDVRGEQINISVHAAGRRISEEGVPETLQSTARGEVRLASNVQFVAQGFYYANPFGSVGPLPPTVNQETTYAVVFTLANTSNRIEDAVLTGELPPYVRWVGVYSPASEQLDFNISDGTLEWDIGDLAPGVGVGSAAPRQVAFAVGLTPSASQVGNSPAMVRELELTGYDTFTEEEITRAHEDVNTNLIDDPGFSSTEASVVLPSSGTQTETPQNTTATSTSATAN